MKFAVGYQLRDSDEESFADLVEDYRDSVGEVYFPWAHLPSGRASLTARRGAVDWGGQARMEEDLARFRRMGLRLDLLFNANCYGGRAVSVALRNLVLSVLERLQEVCGGVDTVTTASLAVAHTVKEFAPGIEVRASVNMRIGAPPAMEAVAHLFDGYYVQREFNRDLAHLRRVKAWADRRGKRIYLLANSGCLHACPGQTFHDNLVAHDAEIDETVNIPDWTPHVCWALYKDRERWPAILQSTWIRPEELRHYEALVPLVKLATRMHANPRMVIDAYSRGRYRGNLLDLLEPGFSPAFAPWVVDNERFPADWFERTSTCGRQCETCAYCRDVLTQVLTRGDEWTGTQESMHRKGTDDDQRG